MAVAVGAIRGAAAAKKYAAPPPPQAAAAAESGAKTDAAKKAPRVKSGPWERVMRLWRLAVSPPPSPPPPNVVG